MTALDFAIDIESAEKIMEIEAEILALNEQYNNELETLQQKFSGLKAPILFRRDVQAETIPSFWSTALLNNSFLQGVALPSEFELLTTKLTKISVERSGDQDFKILFAFAANEHFSNAVLAKEVTFDENSDPTCVVADIKWAKGKRFFTPKKVVKSGKHDHGHSHEKSGFFGWLQDDDSCSANLAMLITEELYPNAGKFYAGEAEDDESDFESEDEDEEMA